MEREEQEWMEWEAISVGEAAEAPIDLIWAFYPKRVPPIPIARNLGEITRGKNKIAWVSDSEFQAIIEQKNLIYDRMNDLAPSPFWNDHRNSLIRDYILPPRGGEFTVPVLKAKFQSLVGPNPQDSLIYKQLIRSRNEFYTNAPFVGPINPFQG
ncbi:hypothetical protein V6N13_090842 [Hibiscus sabdariffa]|uniref:Uncharacterized protein n=2 Tax=Hibiscus sabdariffa TaxID=183260 RepID=A0ABR2BP30_9ROSI